jgi:hypothetical protein
VAGGSTLGGSQGLRAEAGTENRAGKRAASGDLSLNYFVGRDNSRNGVEVEADIDH